MEFEDFYNYYLRSNFRYFPDGQYCNPKKRLNREQIQTKYERYIKKLDSKKIKGNSKYMQKIYDVEDKCKKDDPYAEEFYSRVREYDKQNNTYFERYFKERNKMIGDSYDPAHYFSRGSRPDLACEQLNIIMLPRFVHSLIDNKLEIFSEDHTHKSIKQDRVEQIWQIILGNARYLNLQEMR